MVVSGFWGSAFVEVFRIVAWGKRPSLLWEQIIVTAVATILLLTRNRASARLLFIYCIIGTMAFLIRFGQSSSSEQRVVIARAILYALGAWLIAHWLRRQRLPAPSEPQGVMPAIRTSIVRVLAYWVWFGLVCWFSFQFFWPTQLANWIGKEQLRGWIAESGIPPMVGVIAIVILWLGVTCLLLLLPVWIINRKQPAKSAMAASGSTQSIKDNLQ